MDRMFADSLKKFAMDASDYEKMYVQTKVIAHQLDQKLGIADM